MFFRTELDDTRPPISVSVSKVKKVDWCLNRPWFLYSIRLLYIIYKTLKSSSLIFLIVLALNYHWFSLAVAQ